MNTIGREGGNADESVEAELSLRVDHASVHLTYPTAVNCPLLTERMVQAMLGYSTHEGFESLEVGWRSSTILTNKVAGKKRMLVNRTGGLCLPETWCVWPAKPPKS